MFRVPSNSARDFLKLGSDFQNAACVVFEKQGLGSFPGYALVGQALELYLKAYLRAQGEGLKDVKSIGHNLMGNNQL
ncbi:MAG: hypothetical protein WBW41_18070 [Verrucomicrobiia bacterium]